MNFRLLSSTSNGGGRRSGFFAFGVALVIGLGIGLLAGQRGEANARRRAKSLSEARSSEIVDEIERGLRSSRRALYFLSTLPSIVAHKGEEEVAFESFERYYPEFAEVGLNKGTRRARPRKASVSGPRPLRMMVTRPGVSLYGVLKSTWPSRMLTRGNQFGLDEDGTRALVVGPGGTRVDTEVEPVHGRWLDSRKATTLETLPWTDGESYLTSVRRMRRGSLSSLRLAVVVGVSESTMAHWENRYRMSCLYLGGFLGLFAGTVAWIGIARSTQRLRALNGVLECRVAERTSELEAAERAFRGIFENAPLGLYQCGADGGFLRVNQVFAQTLGYRSSEEAIEGLGSLQAVGDVESRAHFLERIRTGDEVAETTMSVVRADGKVVWIAERARVIRDETGTMRMIEGAIHDVTAQRELECRLRRMGQTDPLTGLLNRRGLAEAIEEAELPMSFVAVDVDRFKSYNDTFGHPAGDHALQVVADTLRRTVRGNDAVARAGGEEFLVVLPKTGAAGARRVAEALRAAVEACDAMNTRLTVSGGVATATTRDEVEEAAAAADRALYRAKESGRNQIVVNPAKMA